MIPDQVGLPRVVHALAPSAAGGLESVVALLARHWTERGGAVALALTLDGDEIPASLASLADAGAVLFPATLRGRAYLRERAHYGAVFRAWQPDLVHTHGYRADVLAGSAAKAHRLPRVSTLHGFTGGDWKNQLYERLQLRSVRRFDGVIAVSPQIQGRLLGAGAEAGRIHLIPNAYAPRRPTLPRQAARAELGLPAEAIVLGWVGRLSHEKGADVLLDALATVTDLPWTLSVIGDGDQRRALERRSAERGLGPRVRWHGLIPEAARLYTAFDAVVLSSRTEGTPIVLLEAMAAEVPIIATQVGGVPDLVRPVDGLLVPPEQPAALGTAIRALLGNPAAARARAASACERVARDYAPGPWLDRHARVYGAILARRRESET